MNLLSEPFWAKDFVVSEPLSLASIAIRRTFNNLVKHRGLSPDRLSDAELIFYCRSKTDDHDVAVRSRPTLPNGKLFSFLIG
jgi:hypothetical protein